ncbi:MAG: DUF6365 family protein [Candidatus Sericytochromatia bacterium]
MKILFLIMGPVSFRAATFLRSFLKQIDLQEHSVTVMSEEFSFFYLEASEKVKFISMSAKNFSEALFQNFMENTKIDKTIIVNLDLLIFDDKKIAFKRSFIQHINTPILFLIENSSLTFNGNSVEIEGIPNSKLELTNSYALIKSCPPHIPEAKYNKDKAKILYWKNLEEFAFLNRDESRTQIRKMTRQAQDSKVITLVLDFEQMFISKNENLMYHYKVLIETVYHYLTSLNIECALLVGNLVDLKLDLQENRKVKLMFLGPLKDSGYEQIIRSSDLVLTESIASTTLIDTANMKIPTINLKSSLYTQEFLDDNGEKQIEILYKFNELTPFAKSKVEDLIVNASQCLFKYYTFPYKASIEFDETKVFGHYIFTFSELFDEKSTTNLIKDLLLNEDCIKEEIYRIEQYLELRSDALDAQELLEESLEY